MPLTEFKERLILVMILKVVNLKLILLKDTISIVADDELKRKQVEELIISHVTRQKVNSKFLSFEKIEIGSGNTIRQNVVVLSGIQRENAQKIIKEIKQMKNKVQVQVQGDELRVSSKKETTCKIQFHISRKIYRFAFAVC